MGISPFNFRGRKLSLSVIYFIGVWVFIAAVALVEGWLTGASVVYEGRYLIEEVAYLTLRSSAAFLVLLLLGCFDPLPLHSHFRRVMSVLAALSVYLTIEALLDGMLMGAFGYLTWFGTSHVAPRFASVLSCDVFAITLLGIFPASTGLWAPRLRVLCDLSGEDFTRINWALAQRSLTSEVELLNVRNTPSKEVAAFARNGLDFLVLSDLTGGLSLDSMGALAAHLNGVSVIDVEEFIARIAERIDVRRIDVATLLSVVESPQRCHLIYRGIKNLVEPLVAACVAVVFSPLIVAAAIAVKCSSPGPILYRQKRVGQFGRNFTILKFRSMRVDAENSGPQWSSSADSRVTKVGRFLRATRLDELPQLWNVMTGSLSFIGPRPERPEFVEILQKNIPAFQLRTILKPGITGWAQVRAGYAASIDESLTKVEHDLYYAAHASLLFDVEIVFRTLFVAVVGDRKVTNFSVQPSSPGKKQPAVVGEGGNALPVMKAG